ncbi:MAG: beta-propeller domain-containing protein [Litorimonas sp.]
MSRTRPLLGFLGALAMLAGLTGCATVSDGDMPVAQTNDTLVAFPSKASLRGWVEDHAQAERLRREAQKIACQSDPDVCLEDEIIVTGSRVASGPNITNVQMAGVDEGDIAKQVGDHLVFLQDGRLFSVSLKGPSPALVDRTDVYDHPGEDVWIDELLVSDRTLVVTGYHYGKRATEISIFRLDRNGGFDPVGQWYIGSDDYYDHDNSATRLIGQTLVFHMPMRLRKDMNWPVLRAAGERSGRPVIEARDVFAPLQPVRWPELHIVMECDLRPTARGRVPLCASRGVITSGGAEWIVSETAGFLWSEPNRAFGTISCDEPEAPAILFRFPLGQDGVEAAFVRARVSDRFSVEARGDRLLALTEPLRTRCEPDAASGRDGLALLDLPMTAFSERPVEVSPAYSTALPGDPDGAYEARFTSDALVYAQRRGRGDDVSAVATVVELASPTRPTRIEIPHAARRIERIGENAVVIGPSGTDDGRATLSASWLDLGVVPTLADTVDLPDRHEAEGRAQALNMRVDKDGGALIGLPTVSAEDGDIWDEKRTTDMTFLRADAVGRLDGAGSLRGDPSRIDPDYSCETSCVDWYGNARPFFVGNRIFALIAAELIEAELRGGTVAERSRLNLSAPD